MSAQSDITLHIAPEWLSALQYAAYEPRTQVETLTARVDLLVADEPFFAPREAVPLLRFLQRLTAALSRALLGFTGESEVNDDDESAWMRLQRQRDGVALTVFAPQRRQASLSLRALAEELQRSLHETLLRTRELALTEAVELWRSELAALERRLLRSLRHLDEGRERPPMFPEPVPPSPPPDPFALTADERVRGRRAARVDDVRMLRHSVAWSLHMDGIPPADVVPLSAYNVVIRRRDGIDLVDLDSGEVVPFTTGSRWQRFGNAFLSHFEDTSRLTFVAADGELLVAKNYSDIRMRFDDVRVLLPLKGRFYVAGRKGLFDADTEAPLIEEAISMLVALSGTELVALTEKGDLLVYDIVAEKVRHRIALNAPALALQACAGQILVLTSSASAELRRYDRALGLRWSSRIPNFEVSEGFELDVAGERGEALVVALRWGQRWLALAFDPLTDQLQLFKRGEEEAPLRAVLALDQAVVVGTDRELVGYPIRGQSPAPHWIDARSSLPNAGPAHFRRSQGLVARVDDDLNVFDATTGRRVSHVDGFWLHVTDVVFDEHFALAVIEADERGDARLHRIALEGMLASVPDQRSA